MADEHDYDYERADERAPSERSSDSVYGEYGRQPQAGGGTRDDDGWLGGGSGNPYGGSSGEGGGRVRSVPGGGSAGGVADWQEDLSDIPVVGWLSGASDATARSEDQMEADRNRGYWHNLARTAPSVDALTPETFLEGNRDAYGDLMGGPSELEGFGANDDQQAAMRSRFS